MKKAGGSPEYDVSSSKSEVLRTLDMKAAIQCGVYLTAQEVENLVEYLREHELLRREPRAPLVGDVVSYYNEDGVRVDGTYMTTCIPSAKDRPIVIMSRGEKDALLTRESKRQYGEVYFPPEYDEDEEE